jgi:aryl-alcohol dehydrogenase-like predicted oxidoreductase
VLEELKQQGLVRFTGLGGTTAYEMARLIRTGKFDVVLTAFNYSLLWREAEREVLPAAIEHDMGIVIGSPLQQGSLARRYDDEVRSGAPWLSSYNASSCWRYTNCWTRSAFLWPNWACASCSQTHACHRSSPARAHPKRSR